MTPPASGDPLVAINAQLLPGSAGGIESNLLALVRSLGAADGGGRQVLIGPGAESGWLRPHLGPNQRLLPWRPIQPLASRQRVRGLRGWWRGERRDGADALDATLEAMGVRAVHCPYQRYLPTSLPAIFEPWDLQHRHLPEFFTAEERQFRETHYRLACDRARLIVTASHWSKRDLVQQFGVEAGKIAVIARGAPDDGVPEPDPAEVAAVRRRLGLPERFVLYPAKTWPHKNHVRLIEALARLRDRHGLTIPLVCTGRPVAEHWPTVQRAIEAHALAPTVRFTGHLDARDMRAVFGAAELLVFPSLFEGLGIPLLEAMRYGVPIVTSHATCLPEVAGSAAVLFDPRSVESMMDAIGTAWTRPALRETCRSRGHARVRDFDWRAAARGFLACYRTLGGVASAADAALVAALVEDRAEQASAVRESSL